MNTSAFDFMGASSPSSNKKRLSKVCLEIILVHQEQDTKS